jgi:hypothetical protein
VECLAGGRDDERQARQADTDEPEAFLPPAVATRDEDPDHVDQDETEDQVRVVVVEIDDRRPAECMEQMVHVPVCQASVGNVDGREQEAGEDLQGEPDREHTAEQVPDAVRLDRDEVLADHLAEAELVAQLRPWPSPRGLR